MPSGRVATAVQDYLGVDYLSTYLFYGLFNDDVSILNYIMLHNVMEIDNQSVNVWNKAVLG
jgi:hypothetical protein